MHGHLIFMYSELRETQMPRLSPAMRTVLVTLLKVVNLAMQHVHVKMYLSNNLFSYSTYAFAQQKISGMLTIYRYIP